MLIINLLPVRQLKKRAKSKKELSLMAFSLVVFCFIFAIITIQQNSTVSNVEDSIKRLKKEKASYAPILRKIALLKKQKIELDRKTEVIKKLQVDSSLTVRALDEVAKSVDNNRMWLTSLKQSGGSLQISGIALDNRTVSDFMKTLKKSPIVTNVNLSSASLHVVSKQNLKKFSLQCSVAIPKKSPKE